MPMLTLTVGRTYTLGQHVFVKGVPHPVDADTYAELMREGRFAGDPDLEAAVAPAAGGDDGQDGVNPAATAPAAEGGKPASAGVTISVRKGGPKKKPSQDPAPAADEPDEPAVEI